jgi:hypothetical protein
VSGLPNVVVLVFWCFGVLVFVVCCLVVVVIPRISNTPAHALATQILEDTAGKVGKTTRME